MKKKIFTLLALFAGVLSASAQNSVVVKDASIAAGKKGSISVELNNPGDVFVAYQLSVKLPAGITYEDVVAESSRYTDHGVLGTFDAGTNVVTIACIDVSGTPGEAILGESGPLFSLIVSADNSLAPGTTLPAQVLNMEFARTDESSFKPAAVDFNIEITDKVILDEESTALPADQEDVNVLVKRTIKKDVWNTICLPMVVTKTEAQNIFGTDVQVAQLSAIAQEGSNVTISFTARTATNILLANKPYLIKTSKDVNEFTLESKTIVKNASPQTVLEDPDEGITLGTFYGTVVSGTVIPKDDFFLSGNKFYYSTGATTIKGFRGYFNVVGFDSSAGAPEIDFVIDGEKTTNIEGIQILTDDGQYYNLKGQKVDNPTEKGVYIKNGKKVVIK